MKKMGRETAWMRTNGEKEEDGEVNLSIRNGVVRRLQVSEKAEDGQVEDLMRNDEVC